MWYKNVGTSFFRFVTIHAFDGQTDGQPDRQTDISLMAKTAMDRCSSVKSLNVGKGRKSSFLQTSQH